MSVFGHVIGFPRIGYNRELKYALENYWNKKINLETLFETGKLLRKHNWAIQKNSEMNLITVGDFSWYDHVLTTSCMVGNVPYQYKKYTNNLSIDVLFNIARGVYISKDNTLIPLEMKKWYNTNYHYIVPEFTENQIFSFQWSQILDEVDEALLLGYKNIKVTLLGPITYLWIGKIKGKLFDKLSLLPSLVSVYKYILQALKNRGINWIQIEEPALLNELPINWRKSYCNTYQSLYGYLKILLTTYFGSVYHNLDFIKELSIDGIHIDCTLNNKDLFYIEKYIPKNFVLSAGIINGRNIWRSDLYKCFDKLSIVLNKRSLLWVSASCSFLHIPYDINKEKKLNIEIKKLFSFTVQKCTEINLLVTALNNPNDNNIKKLKEYSNVIVNYINQQTIKNNSLIEYLTEIPEHFMNRKSSCIKRSIIQKNVFNFPLFPVTTIGSFPQTKHVRKLRYDYKNRYLSKEKYINEIQILIRKTIYFQEKIGLDVLVHGEFERNDMVEYFSENLNGFISTEYGWVQSYGSRCVKPPIIIGDITRSKPITVKWISYAQSLTKKPVKGILTGPLTMLLWSFYREDIIPEKIVQQIALALRDEVKDLENAGIQIIQIDEPALREGLPISKKDRKKYVSMVVDNFRLMSSVVQDSTQIHTHMCYSEFTDVIEIIKLLDVDVITLELSRSNDYQFLNMFKQNSCLFGIGPGVYDVHSKSIPSKNRIKNFISDIMKLINVEKIWINPDCGLKTRSWIEVRRSLMNIMSVINMLRKSV